MFINLKDGQISIKSFRDNLAMATDIIDILFAIENDTGEHLVIELEGVKGALEDGEYLSSIDVSQITAETLHGAICEAEE